MTSRAHDQSIDVKARLPGLGVKHYQLPAYLDALNALQADTTPLEIDYFQISLAILIRCSRPIHRDARKAAHRIWKILRK